MNKQLVHSVFEQTAAMHARRTAVVDSDSSITYQDLNAGANTLAYTLLQLGSETGEIVAVCMESSIEYVSSILGISKAGGVFMPVEPDVPVMRLDYVLRLTKPKILVTRRADAQKLLRNLEEINFPVGEIKILAVGRVGNHLRVEALDGTGNFAGTDAVHPPENPATAVTGECGSYLMFTSGSTGTPKAIEGRHKSLSHFIHWEIGEFALTRQPRVSQFAPLSFDVSLRDIFVPLLSGGTLCIPPKDYKFQIDQLLDWIAASRITVIHLVPTLFRLLTEAVQNTPGAAARLQSIEVMLLAGEPLYGKDVLAWRKLMGNATQLVNLYGPTETTLAKLFYRIPDEPLEPGLTIPLGKPIANTAVLILSNNQLCQVGETGEIHIKTPFTSRGYFNDPALNAAQFIQNPLHDDHKDIIYKTGDLGRYTVDRTVAFAGRSDSQLKIRGNRVEIPEIESTLLGFPAIAHAVVIARGNADHDYDLVCYYTGRDGEQAEAEAIKAHLSRHLPVYMHPAYFCPLERFPVSGNGKINRLALKELPLPVTGESPAAGGPATETEEKVSAIWMEVLKLGKLSCHDSFFMLGGSSLKAIQVLSRIYKSFGILFKLPDLFGHDTVREFARLIDRAANTGSAAKAAYEGIVPVARQAHYPVSHAQKRLWILSHFEHQQAAYNIPKAYLIEGNLNRKALHDALEAITARHESFRTVFITVNGEPRQQCIPAGEAAWQPGEVDLRGTADNLPVARQLVVKHSLEPFDLAKGPLLRTELIRLEDNKYALLLNLHHIVGDGRSVELLVKELLTLYAAFSKGEPSPLVPLKIQYKDFAAWHNNLLQDNKLLLQKQYWLDKLQGELPVLHLPADYPYPAEPTHRGEIVNRQVDQATAAWLEHFGKENGTTLYMVLLAAVKVLLHRHTGQSDLIVGSPISGREVMDLENQVGVYINMLALRTVLEPGDTYAGVLGKVKKTTLEAYENQRYPFDKLVDDLKLERDARQTPLFNVTMSLELASDEYASDAHASPEYAGIKVHAFPLDQISSKYDLDFNFRKSNEGLLIHIHYKADLFSRKRIENMAGQLENLLGLAGSTAGQQPVGTLDFLPPAEKELLLHGFNDTDCAFADGDKTLAELFEAQAARTPHALAVVFGNTHLSYAQLDAKANQLAGWLRSTHQITAPDLVGVLLSPSPWLAVTVLGVLKAGAAFVPINPEDPLERIRYIVEDTRMRVLLADDTSRAKAQAGAFSGVATVAVEQLDWHADSTVTDSPVVAPARTSTPTDLAYVIYTSGSSGMPKGVEVELASVTNYLLWANRYYFNDGPGFPFGVCTPLAFDLTITGLFSTLLRGDVLYLLDTADMYQALRAVFGGPTPIAAVKLTPSHITLLGGLPLDKTRVERVIVGGEALTGEQVNILRRLNGQMRIYNEYGPTETTVGCSVKQVERAEPAISVGSPIANTRIYVLGGEGQLQPVGVYGEICVGGAGLARGYLHQEPLTAEKFVPDPFRQGERLYRTGDRGRWQADGTIEYGGRHDEQLKVRGYRIEPGEVEAALCRHPAISQAVVTGRRSGGATSLVAYFVSSQPLTPASLRTFLQPLLPEYMIPPLLVALPRLPLTLNGKVDKKALPEPDPLLPQQEWVAPQTPQETLLVELWQQLLGRPRVGVNDNFFLLGGDSIKAIQVASRMHAAGYKLQVKDLFQHSTIRELARVALAQLSPSDESPVSGQVPLTPIQAAFFAQRLAQPHHYNQAILLAFPQRLEPAALREVFDKLLLQHDALRMRYQWQQEQVQQYNAPPGETLWLQVQDWRGQAPAPQVLQAHINQVQASLDLQQGPLLKAALFQLPDGDRLLVVIHHLVVDGVSWRILLEDLGQLLTQQGQGQALRLPPKSSAYQRWAISLQGLADEPVFAGQRPYWQQVQRQALALLAPPVQPVTAQAVAAQIAVPTQPIAAQAAEAAQIAVADQPAEAVPQVGFVLSPLQTRQLLTQAPAAFHTEINDLLLAALSRCWQLVLHRPQVVVALEGHGREALPAELEIGRTVGWFTSLYPVILEGRAGQPLDWHLKQTKEHLRSIPGKGIGYGVLKYLSSEGLGAEDGLPAGQPLPVDLCFNYLGQFDSETRQSSFGLALEQAGESVSRLNAPPYGLTVTGLLLEGSLQMRLAYQAGRYPAGVMEQLSHSYQQTLVEVIDYCCSRPVSQKTPSDFTYKELSLDEFDTIFE